MTEFDGFRARLETEEFGEMVLDCTPDNTILYLHHPQRNRDYDHFFVQLPPEYIPEHMKEMQGRLGGFVTRQVLGEEQFESLANRVSESYSRKIIYSPDPTPNDKAAIDEQLESSFHQEIEDINPEDFL